MSFRRGGRNKGNEGDDKGQQELKKKAQNEVYDLDTDTLLLQTKRSYEAAKTLNKEQKNIRRKREKDRSKELSKCMETYDDRLTEIEKAVALINLTLENITRIPTKAYSMREPKRSKQQFDSNASYSVGIEKFDGEQRPEERGAAGTSKVYRERQAAYKSRPNDGEGHGAAGTDNALERLDSSPRTNRKWTDTIEELEGRINLLNREKEDIQQKLKEERNAKDDYRKKLEEVSGTHVTVDVFNELKQQKDSLNKIVQQLNDEREDFAERIRQEQEKHQQELYTLNLKCKAVEEAKQNAVKSLQSEVDKIRHEKKNLSLQYEDEKKAKNDAITRLDNMSKASVAVDIFEKVHEENESLKTELQRLKQKLCDEMSAKDDSIQRLSQDLERIRCERENYSQRCNTEAIEKNRTISMLQQDLERIKHERDNLRQECKAEKDKNNRLKQNVEMVVQERDKLSGICKTEQDQKKDALQRLDQLRSTHCPKESLDKLEIQLISLTKEKESLCQQLQNKQATMDETYKSLQQDLERVRQELEHFRQQCYAEKEEKNRIQKEKDMIAHDADNERQQYEAEIGAKDNAIRRLQQEKDKIMLERDNARKQYKAEKEAKDDAFNRLSLMASSKLRDNNPNITDLSDQNRPTKIAEKLSELYDNQWTDAFDALEQQNKEEREIINMLLESLMTAYEECSKLANDNYFETVQRAIECRKQGPKSSPYRIVMSDQLKQEVKELRKSQAIKVWEDIKEIVFPRIQLSDYHSEVIESYISICIEICWLMVVQDPPVVLNSKAKSKFDTSIFKDYTKRGPLVEFVVWPALLLHESGPLLSKGVAQGCELHPINQGDQSKNGNQLFTQSIGGLPRRDGDENDHQRRMASTFCGVSTGIQAVHSQLENPPTGDEPV